MLKVIKLYFNNLLKLLNSYITVTYKILETFRWIEIFFFLQNKMFENFNEIKGSREIKVKNPRALPLLKVLWALLSLNIHEFLTQTMRTCFLCLKISKTLDNNFFKHLKYQKGSHPSLHFLIYLKIMHILQKSNYTGNKILYGISFQFSLKHWKTFNKILKSAFLKNSYSKVTFYFFLRILSGDFD